MKKKRLLFVLIPTLVALLVGAWSLGFNILQSRADDAPTGALDAISTDGVVTGWALSLSHPEVALDVHFYVDGPAGGGGKFIGAAKADQPRPDINKGFGKPGNHGFVWTVPPSVSGTHQFYAYAIRPDWHPGLDNPLLLHSPTSATIGRHKPMGTLDGVSDDGVLWGWALAPDHPEKTLDVHIYVDGPAGNGGTFLTVLKANQPGKDVNDATGYPGNHRYAWFIPAQFHTYAKGHHQFYAYAIDPDGGYNPLLTGSPRTLNTPYRKPQGFLDGVNKDGVLWGWTLAPEHPDQTVVVHIYINGPAGGGGQLIAVLLAAYPRNDVNKATGYAGMHGFQWLLPDVYKTGKKKFYAYAIDPDGGSNPLLGNSPISFGS